MARADTENAQYHADLKDLQAQIKADQATIQQIEQQKAQVQTQIIYRDKAADSKIEAVSAPNRSEQQVSDDVLAAYKFPPIKFDSGQFWFTLPETQAFAVTKLDRDRLSSDLQDTQNQLALETTASTTLSKDLQACQKDLTEAQKVITDYKKVVVKSKFKQFLGAAEKVGLFAAGLYLGRRL